MKCPKCPNESFFTFICEGTYHIRRHEGRADRLEVPDGETAQVKAVECDECNYISNVPEEFGLVFQEAKAVR